MIREGSGAGHGIDADLGQAHESAIKEAETDAMKRALMTFGNPFGLALYDKQQREVSSSITTLQPAVKPQLQSQALSDSAGQQLDPALSPLDPATIRRLQGTLQRLPRPVLDGFTKAFRKRFSVPAEAPSIADRICQKRHHDWIETYLAQQQLVAA